ncbi:MAG: Rab family GTPase [Candidatus Thorarchaeota archaeon]|jgi:small GTP-binding protein
MYGRPPVFKTVLIGEGGVGKTSITLRYTEDTFDDNMKITIGVNLASKKIQVGDRKATLMMWDLGGQPRFRDVVSDYFRGSKIAIAVYDSTRFFSLERLNEWVERLKESAPDCELIFVGNKIDERVEGSGVSLSDCEVFAARFDAPCTEVSAKTGEGVEEMFEMVVKILFEKHLQRD